MHFIRVLSLALVGLAVARDVPRTLTGPEHLLKPAGQGSQNVIRGLLGGSRISGRQASGCNVGTTVCDVEWCCPTTNVCCTGGFCCEAGTYCDTVNGQLGCCQDGEICTGTSNECSSSGYSLCPGDTYCCPTGDTCFRDSTGTANCSPGGGGGGTGGGSTGGGSTISRTSSSGVASPSTNSVVFVSSSNTPKTTSSVSSVQTSTSSSGGSGSGSSSGSSSSSGNSLTGSGGSRTFGEIQGLALLPIIGFAAAFLL